MITSGSRKTSRSVLRWNENKFFSILNNSINCRCFYFIKDNTTITSDHTFTIRAAVQVTTDTYLEDFVLDTNSDAERNSISSSSSSLASSENIEAEIEPSREIEEDSTSRDSLDEIDSIQSTSNSAFKDDNTTIDQIDCNTFNTGTVKTFK